MTVWYHYNECEDTEFVNCKFTERGDCHTHRPRTRVQSTPPLPHLTLGERRAVRYYNRAKKRPRPKSPKGMRLLYVAVSTIQPMGEKLTKWLCKHIHVFLPPRRRRPRP